MLELCGPDVVADGLRRIYAGTASRPTLEAHEVARIVTTQPKRALITGITGQDGSFLAELLLEKGYEGVGMVRGGSECDLGCSEHLRAQRDTSTGNDLSALEGTGGQARERLMLVDGDLLDASSLRAAVENNRPEELYHLASPSFVPASWERPAETLRAIAGSTATLCLRRCATRLPRTLRLGRRVRGDVWRGR